MITNTVEISAAESAGSLSNQATATQLAEFAAETADAVNATPAAMPVTGGAKENRGLAILLTVAAVLMLIVGLVFWEKREVLS